MENLDHMMQINDPSFKKTNSPKTRIFIIHFIHMGGTMWEKKNGANLNSIGSSVKLEKYIKNSLAKNVQTSKEWLRLEVLVWQSSNLLSKQIHKI